MVTIAIECGWTLIAYCCFMVLDMLMLNSAGYNYIAPKGAPDIAPRFWIGFKARHVLLLPIAFLSQYLVRRHMAEASPLWLGLGALALPYLVLFFVNILGERRPNS